MQKDNTRAQLIYSATKLFAQKSFSGTSVKDIADHAGVNVSLVSYHFGGKEALYKTCFEEYVNKKMEFVQKNLKVATSREDFKLRLRHFIENVVDEDLKEPDIGCIIRREIEFADPIILEVFQKTVLPLFRHVYEFIEAGQKSNFIRSDVHARTAAVLFMGGLQHAIRTDSLRKKLFNESLQDQKTKEDLINSALEMFMSGMEARKG